MTKILQHTRKAAFMSLLLFVGLPAAAALQTSQRTVPIETFNLENGIELVCENDNSSGITVVQFFFKGGLRAEPEGKAGLAYLTTRLTLEIPDQSKTQALMDQATRLFMGCEEDFTFVTLSCLSVHLEDAIKLVSKIMQKPLISGIRIDRVKKQMERQRKTEEDDSVHMAHTLFKQAFFSETPYASQVFGSEKSLKAIHKNDITWYFRQFLHPGNMLVVVSSDQEASDILALIDHYYGAASKGPAAELPKFKRHPAQDIPVFLEKEAEQSFVSAGYGLDINSPADYVLGYLLDCLLGKGIQSRMWDLRVRQKLAYSVQTRLNYATQGSILEAFLETDSAKTEQARSSLKALLDGLQAQGIDADELIMTKNYAKSLLLRNNETKETRTRSLAVFQTMGLGYSYLNTMLEEMEAVTLEQINGFIQTCLAPENCVFVIIGPADK